jgi:flagellar protein FlgJ
MSAPLNINATSGGLAADAQSLVQLRVQAKQSPDKALKGAAQQFESVFLNMMLKSMRDATSQDGMFDNEQSKMFTGMLDQQFAQNLSKKGIGLADSLVRQLSRHTGGLPPAAEGTSKATSPTAQPNSTGKLDAIPTPYTAHIQQDFVNRMLPHALQASQSSGVPPQLMLGQAALESGWGKREIRTADGSNSYNLFGIKAGSGWNGKVASVTTTEYQNGIANKQVENFRAYSSYAEAFKDYAHMLSTNPRYAGVLQQAGDAAGMAQALQQGGYATDPHYADKLAQIMGKMKFSG